MRIVLCLALLMILPGCASFSEETHRTLLMDSSTGETKECTVDRWRNAESYDRYRQCISAYEKEGYKIWSQY